MTVILMFNDVIINELFDVFKVFNNKRITKQ